jgi:putative flippase GtrA
LSDALAPDPGVQRLAATYRRFRQAIHEGAKFGIVGLTGLAVTNLAFVPLHESLHLGPLTSVTIAYALATVVTFLGNRYWSFRDREGAGTARESALFFLLNGVGLLIQYAVLGLGNYGFGLTSRIENLVAVNLGIGLGTLFRFWSYRKWVWVSPQARAAKLRRGRHRAGRPAQVQPPAPQRLATLPDGRAPGAGNVWDAGDDNRQPTSGQGQSAPWSEAGQDQFWDDLLAERLRQDTLRRARAVGSSERRRPQTPAAG